MLLYTATAKRALTARIRTPSAMRPRLRASACPRGGGTAPSSRRRASGLAGRVIVVMIRLRSLVQSLDLGHRDGDALRAGRGVERSEERRVGQECVSTCSSWCSPYT